MWRGAQSRQMWRGVSPSCKSRTVGDEMPSTSSAHHGTNLYPVTGHRFDPWGMKLSSPMLAPGEHFDVHRVHGRRMNVYKNVACPTLCRYRKLSKCERASAVISARPQDVSEGYL